uniref:Vav 3 guanine nucleotide exchange factor b n=1 Tax=Neogobius melanostomus TaxID=47308 RepID=A0A8C6UNC8_9GOBI
QDLCPLCSKSCNSFFESKPNKCKYYFIHCSGKFFLCLKNIRTFLTCCYDVFGMKKCDLFEAFDLFDVRDFGKVMDTLSKLSQTITAQQQGFKPFPTEESLNDEDIYNNLEDLIDENAPEDEDELYAAVYGYEEDYAGGEIYEDLMRTDLQSPLAEVDVRSCCLSEIKQTEEKYTETLESIEKYFLNPLRKFFTPNEIDRVFVNIPDLVRLHKSLMVDVQDSILNKNALNLYQIFIAYKERYLYFWLVHKTIECARRANNGKFTLRDLLVVPMQRVLKYHLLLQELVKHTHDAAEKSNLKIALDAMKDLAQYVNEVKRDNETLREIDQYQRCIENLNQPLIAYGRPKGDGEVRLVSSVDKRKQDRHIFLFDIAVIICKRRGYNYEMKDVLDLHYYKVTNNPTSDREAKKWCYGFYITHQQGHTGFELFFKTRELKKKWLDQFEMAISNIRPDKANHNYHQFKMHTFERIMSCSYCHLLLRGIFNQGYLCLKCGLGAHKECLGRMGLCGRTGNGNMKAPMQAIINGCTRPSLPRMVVIRDYSGVPCPQCGPPLSVHTGDTNLMRLYAFFFFFLQGKILATSKIGFFPSDAVRPCPCVPKPVDYSGQPWFAGPLDRSQAEEELQERDHGTFLIRNRSKECTEYAVSIKFSDKVKHIKILTKDSCFYIAEARLFKTELVEYYKQHSLKEGFSSLDTTLLVPYRELSNGNMPGAITKAVIPHGFCSFVPPASSPFWSVFCPRVVGIAVARYDFSSRDTRELSLLQGDSIKIFTKLSNGWWKGEVDGRVRYFYESLISFDYRSVRTFLINKVN